MLIAESRLARFGFDTVIFNEGFVLDEASPPVKIIARLEREGCAVGRPEQCAHRGGCMRKKSARRIRLSREVLSHAMAR
jgi:hypothetical protein